MMNVLNPSYSVMSLQSKFDLDNRIFLEGTRDDSSFDLSLEDTPIIDDAAVAQSSFKIEHRYHDHAHETRVVTPKRSSKGGVVTTFPLKLHRLLERIEEDGYGDVVSWQPHGRAFVVRKPADFKLLLPLYFNNSKMTSFQRQINLYGFSRITQGLDKGGYYHEFFLRGKPELTTEMRRFRVKGTGVRQSSDPNNEPDFWNMPWVGKTGSIIPSAGNHDQVMISKMSGLKNLGLDGAFAIAAADRRLLHLADAKSNQSNLRMSWNEAPTKASTFQQENQALVGITESALALSELPLDGLLRNFDCLPANEPEKILNGIRDLD